MFLPSSDSNFRIGASLQDLIAVCGALLHRLCYYDALTYLIVQ